MQQSSANKGMASKDTVSATGLAAAAAEGEGKTNAKRHNGMATWPDVEMVS